MLHHPVTVRSKCGDLKVKISCRDQTYEFLNLDKRNGFTIMENDAQGSS